MITLDTNVLLRYLLWDEPEQARKAHALIQGEKAVLLTDIALVEAVWTLQGKRYGLGKNTIIQVIHALFMEPNVFFESAETVWRALCDYQNSPTVKSGGKRKQADFADALFVNKAKYSARQKGVEFIGAYTFDVAAQELPDTKAP